MSFSKKFRHELSFLKNEGQAFSEIYPHLAKFLSSDSMDPEAQRIIESFAFLTTQLKEKIDDDFPEFTHSILHLLCPNYLRPIPSCSIVQFKPRDSSISTKQTIKKGTQVDSKPVDGTKCQFTTCCDVNVFPISLLEATESQEGRKSRIVFDMLKISGRSMAEIECDELSIHLSGDDYSSFTCYQWFMQYLEKITLVVSGMRIDMPISLVTRGGFSENEALLPYPDNAFDGYRVLQEFFHFPKRFSFISLNNLSDYFPDSKENNFQLEFSFRRAMPLDLELSKQNFKLYCTPVINLFEHDAIPINLDGKQLDYPLLPVGGNKSHFEIFAINNVTGLELSKVSSKNNRTRIYPEFESFAHNDSKINGESLLYYKHKIKESIDEIGFRHFLSFVRPPSLNVGIKDETISIELNCCNRDLPEVLGVGDISTPSQDTPSYVEFSNIVKPTSFMKPVLDGELQWTLISNLSLNYLSLTNLSLLKSVLSAYDFSSHYDIQSQRRTEKRLNAIKKIETAPIDRLLKGTPSRGGKTTLFIDSSEYSCEGELYLFGSVLAEFFSLYAGINSFHILEIINQNNNEVFTWEAIKGKQPAL